MAGGFTKESDEPLRPLKGIVANECVANECDQGIAATECWDEADVLCLPWGDTQETQVCGFEDEDREIIHGGDEADRIWLQCFH